MQQGAETGRQETFFHHDVARLNGLAESVTLLASFWLGRVMQASWLPDHAKRSYIDYLAHNYDRCAVPDLARAVQLLGWRLDRHYSRHNAPFSASGWYACARHLHDLPPLPDIAAERRFMRYLALRDLWEFSAGFAALMPPGHLRPWVGAALEAALAHNHLQGAWENSITLWDSVEKPRPRTFIRAQIHPGLWRSCETGERVLH